MKTISNLHVETIKILEGLMQAENIPALVVSHLQSCVYLLKAHQKNEEIFEKVMNDPNALRPIGKGKTP